MKLSETKVATRLGASFAIVVLLAIATAGLALREQHVIETNLEDIVLDNNVKLKLNNDMSESVHIVSRVMRTVALIEDKLAKEAERQKIVKARASYNAAWMRSTSSRPARRARPSGPASPRRPQPRARSTAKSSSLD